MTQPSVPHALAAVGPPPAPAQVLPLARVLQLARHFRVELAVVVIYAAALGVLALAAPLAVQVLINTIAFTGLRQPVVVVSLLLATSLTLAAFFQAAQTVAVESISQRLFVETALGFARSLSGVSPHVRSHVDLRRLSNHFYDVVTVEKTSWSLLFEGPTAVLQILVGLTLLAFYHPFLLLFGIGLSLASLFIIFALGRGALYTAIKESSLKHKLAAHLQEVGLHVDLFSSSRGRQFAIQRITDEANGWLNIRQSHFRIVLGQMMGFWVLQAVGSATLLLAGGSLVAAGQLTLGQLVAAELVMATTAASLAKLGKMLPKFYDLNAALVKLAMVTELVQEATGKVKQHPSQSVSLRLQSQVANEEPVEILSANPGKLYLVTGSRDQLNHLCELLHGRIIVPNTRLLLDDTPIEMWDPGSLRDRAHVLCGRWIPGKDIFAQARLGLHQLSDETVWAALSWAGLEGLLVGWQQRQVDTAAFEHSPLNASQTVALALARAVLAKPGLVICQQNLDGLRPEEQKHLMHLLESKCEEWTALVLTQDAQLLQQGPARITLPAAALSGSHS